MRKREKKRAAKAAKHLPNHMADVAFTKFKGRYRRGRLGKFGPASEVRIIK